jgi:hypothetical protein
MRFHAPLEELGLGAAGLGLLNVPKSCDILADRL